MKTLLILFILIFTFTRAFSCDYTVDLHDTFGDSWNGNSITISVNGTPVLTNITVTAGSDESHNFSANAGDVVSISFDDSGSWDSECEITITSDDIATVVYTDGMGSTVPMGGAFTVATNCGIAPPANDEPCAAINLPMGTACNPATGSVNGATTTTVPNPSCGSFTTQGDVWYETTVGASGLIQIDLTDGGIDANMAIYDGPDCNNLNEVGCSVGNAFFSDAIPAGTQLWVRIWDENNSIGSFTICAWAPAPPVNTDPCGAIELTAAPMCNMETYDNSYSTDSGIPDPGCANYNGGDIWFMVTVPPEGLVTIETAAGNITEAGLAIYTSSSNNCNDLTFNQCVDNWSMPFVTINSLTPGDIIWIRLWDNGGDNWGTFDICVTSTSGPPDCSSATPAGDECSNASPICNLEGYCGNTSDAYTPGSDPSAFCGSIENSSWISFQAGATDAVLYVWTMNCANDDGIQMEIYETTDCINYSSVSECISTGTMEDFSITATGLVIGETYYLMIDGFAGDVCDYVVSAGEGVMTATAVVVETGTNTASICSGCVNLEASGGTGYEWSPAATLDDPNIANPMACPTETTTYTVTVTGGNPDCPSNATATTTVYIEASFNTEISSTALVCHDDVNATITATVSDVGASSVFNYEWSTGVITGMIADTTYTITNLSAGDYTVTITEELGCSSVHNITIDNPPALSMTFSTVSEYCGMEDGIINASISDGTSPFNFSWVDTDGGVTNGNSSSANNPFSIPNVEAGNYIIDLVDDNGCTVTNSVTVNDSGSVTAGFDINNDQCLEGNSFDFTNTSTVSNGIIYNITSPNSTSYTVNGSPDYTGFIADIHGVWTVTQDISSGSCLDATTSTFEVFEEPVLSETHIDITCNAFTDAVINANSTIPGTYTMISGIGSFIGSTASSLPLGTYTFVVETAQGCNDTLTITLTEPETLILATTTTDLDCYNVCNGTGNVTVVSGGTAPYAYDWGTYGTLQEATDLCAGSYTVTVTDFNSCTEEATVTINEPTELVLASFTEPTSCFGFSDARAWVEAQGGTTPYSYLWSNNSIDDGIINIPSSYYGVTVTDANGCIRNIDGINVEQPNEVILALEYEPYICIGQSSDIRMSATSSPFSPYTYFWNGVQSSDIITVSPQQSTTYSAQVIDAHGCESIIRDITVNVHPPISLEATIDYKVICKGDVVNISLITTGGNGNYSYRLIDGTVLTEPISLSPEQSIDYYVIASDDCGSPEDTVILPVEVKEIIIPSYHADIKHGCKPLTINYIQDTEAHEEGTSYLWNFGDESSSNISFDNSPTHIYNTDGTFHVSLKITSPFGCESESIEYNYITVFPLPIASFTANPTMASILKPIIYFANTSTGADLALWSFGDQDSSLNWSPEHKYADYASDYYVTLVSVNRFGCSDTITNKVSIKDEVTFYIPSGFTPDFDGKNEIFTVTGHGVVEEGFEMLVYDRWGEVIFNTTDLKEGWNGKIKGGSYGKPGIYPYVIKFIDIYGVPHERSGSVNLIR